MELPLENVGKAMTDIKRMSGEFEGYETENGMAVLKGSVPAAEMNGYQKNLRRTQAVTEDCFVL